jgi:hypothetical protein
MMESPDATRSHRVIPAKAGTHFDPAREAESKMDSGFRRHDDVRRH